MCGIPIGTGIVDGNCHRIYNKKRIDKMFSLFDEFVGSVNYENFNGIFNGNIIENINENINGNNELNFVGNNWQNQPIFVYKK